MASTDVSGLNGSVTLPSAHGGIASGFSLRVSQRKKDTSRYGGTRIAQVRGGLLDVTGSVKVFMRKGSSGDAVGLASPAQDGASLVLTADTGCLWTLTALIDPSINAAFNDPSQEATYDFTANAIAETYAVS